MLYFAVASDENSHCEMAMAIKATRNEHIFSALAVRVSAFSSARTYFPICSIALDLFYAVIFFLSSVLLCAFKSISRNTLTSKIC